MRLSLITTSLALLATVVVYSQNITKSEYWVDSQYDLAVQTNHSSSSVSLASLDLGNLAQGFHLLHFRALDDQGLWSSVSSRSFFYTGSLDLDLLEYWVDNDHQNRTPLTLSEGSAMLDIAEVGSNLSSGVHRLHFRTRDENGKWSAIATRSFLVSGNEVMKLRYWFDEDFANHRTLNNLPPTGSWTLDQLNLAPMQQGQYDNMHFQFLDANGKWSSVYSSGSVNYQGPESITFVEYPFLDLNQTQFELGTTIEVSGEDFSPNAQVFVTLEGYQVVYSENVLTDSTGTFTLDIEPLETMAQGHYTISATDEVNNHQPSISFEFLGAPQTPSSSLEILMPTSNSCLRAELPFILSWRDRMLLRPGYPVNLPYREYAYRIESSTDGITWSEYELVQGEHFIYQTLDQEIQVTWMTEGPLKLRVIDELSGDLIIAETDWLAVETGPFQNATVERLWDWSYSNMEGGTPILGTCADGVSRFVFSIQGVNGGPSIESVTVTLEDSIGNSGQFLGKLQPAQNWGAYSEEANTAYDTLLTFSQVDNNEVFFWYVAPDDFSRGPIDFNSKDRAVNLEIDIVYENNSSENSTEKITIARPPVLMVHGLGGDRDTWDDILSGTSPFRTQDFHYAFPSRINPYSSFDDNANLLMTSTGVGSINPNPEDHVTFQDAIAWMRNKGFACNQVDYVGHSMGGVVGRYAEWAKEDQFYRSGAYSSAFGKNYGQGFVNKFITINSPHSGSFWPDILGRYSQNLGAASDLILHSTYLRNPNGMAFTFFRRSNPGGLIPNYDLHPAMSDLRIGDGIGVDHQETELPSHLISSDFIDIEIVPGLPIPQTILNDLSDLSDFSKTFGILSAAASIDDFSSLGQIISPIEQDNELKAISKLLLKFQSIADTWNLSTSIWDSDFIVGLNSQEGEISFPNQHVTRFDGLMHCHCGYLPYSVLEAPQTAAKLKELLNSNISSPSFSSIPETQLELNIPEFETDAFVETIFDLDIFDISLFDPEAIYDVGDLFEFGLDLPDVSGFFTGGMIFQGNFFPLRAESGFTNYQLEVTPDLLGEQEIISYLFYRSNSDTLITYINRDTISILPSSELISFNSNEEVLYMMKNETAYPGYYAVYEDFVTPVLNFSSAISASIDDPSLVSFDNLTKQFTGIEEGITFAEIEYEGLIDTLWLVVANDLLPDTSIVDFIPEFSNGTKANNLSLTPNPTDESTAVSLNLIEHDELEFQVISLKGQIVLSQRIGRFSPGKQAFDIDVSNIQPGVYIVQVRGKKFQGHAKLLIE